MGCIGMRGGGRGKEAYGHHLIRSLFDSQPASRTDRQPVHDIGEGSWQARPAMPDQIRPDQTDRLRSCSRVLCSWAERARDGRLLPFPKLRCSKYARDFLRFVPLFRQDERRE